MRTLLLLIAILFTNAAFGEDKKYGSFVLNSQIPNTLFFVDEIKSGDSFELRKAIRNHKIENIILTSPGGSVWEGLQMAGLIFDKKLRTYVPEGATCASACAFLLFAGNERLVDGRLGVHQAYSKEASKQQAIGQTQYATQFTVSEIIGFLNEFRTPAFVFEKMFQDVEMYFFDTAELMELNSEEFKLSATEKSEIKRIALELINASNKNRKLTLNKIPSSKERYKTDNKELIILIQKRLKAIGCNPGPSDGVWGTRTQAAAIAFAKKAGLPSDGSRLLSKQFFEKLTSAPSGYCPKSKPSFKVSFAKVYDVYCDGYLASNSPFKITYFNKNKRIFTEDKLGNSINGFYTGSTVNMGGLKILLNQNSTGFVTKMIWSNKSCSQLVAVPR